MKTVKIRDNFWKIKSSEYLEEDLLGLCDYETKTLSIPFEGSSKLELDTIIHEAIHAGIPDLNEDAVNETASDIAKILWRLNWRKQINE